MWDNDKDEIMDLIRSVGPISRVQLESILNSPNAAASTVSSGTVTSTGASSIMVANSHVKDSDEYKHLAELYDERGEVVDNLKFTMDILKDENARLKAEIAALQKKKQTKAAKPKSTVFVAQDVEANAAYDEDDGTYTASPRAIIVEALQDAASKKDSATFDQWARLLDNNVFGRVTKDYKDWV